MSDENPGRTEAVLEEQEPAMLPWWGHSKEHGWVVLDRSVASNTPGTKRDLMFVRCRDTMIVMEKRERWIPPGYRFAPNYIRDLPPTEAHAAAADLDDLKARWPEFEGEIQRVCREAEERVEAVRVGEEKAKKEAAAERKKQAAAAKA